MNSFRIQVLKDSDTKLVMQLLDTLKQKEIIEYSLSETDDAEESHRANEEQVQEIIDEAELGPFYSDKEAKNILNM